MQHVHDICARIDNALGSLFDSTTAAAKAIGVDRGTLSKYRQGRKNPNLTFLQKLSATAAELGSPVDLNWLITGKGLPQGAKQAARLVINVYIKDEKATYKLIQDE